MVQLVIRGLGPVMTPYVFERAWFQTTEFFKLVKISEYIHRNGSNSHKWGEPLKNMKYASLIRVGKGLAIVQTVNFLELIEIFN